MQILIGPDITTLLLLAMIFDVCKLVGFIIGREGEPWLVSTSGTECCQTKSSRPPPIFRKSQSSHWI